MFFISGYITHTALCSNRDFKTRFFISQMGKNQLLAEVKWLPELDVDKRMQGDYVWFKLGFLF